LRRPPRSTTVVTAVRRFDCLSPAVRTLAAARHASACAVCKCEGPGSNLGQRVCSILFNSCVAECAVFPMLRKVQRPVCVPAWYFPLIVRAALVSRVKGWLFPGLPPQCSLRRPACVWRLGSDLGPFLNFWVGMVALSPRNKCGGQQPLGHSLQSSACVHVVLRVVVVSAPVLLPSETLLIVVVQHLSVNITAPRPLPAPRRQPSAQRVSPSSCRCVSVSACAPTPRPSPPSTPSTFNKYIMSSFRPKASSSLSLKKNRKSRAPTVARNLWPVSVALAIKMVHV